MSRNSGLLNGEMNPYEKKKNIEMKNIP